MTRLPPCGVTLIEVLVATAMITVGLTAVAAGYQHAVVAVETGRQHTTALYLAEQQLERIKATALVDYDRVANATFPDEESVADYPQYRRRVDVIPNPAGIADAVRVQVTVAYRPVSVGPRMVTLATVLWRRP